MTELKAHLLSSTDKTDTDPLKADFRKFLWLIWKHIGLPEPTQTQYEIAYFLQHGPNKLCIQAFRGVGKSFITSAFVLWCLYCDPQLKIMVVSASKLRADNFVKFCKMLIATVPELQHLKPRQGQRDSSVEFDVGPATPDQSASVFARGIDSQLAGGRADIIVSDDVEVPNNSMTAEMRDKLQEKIKEFSAIIKPLPTSRFIYLGTPQTEDSIYNKLPDTIVTRIWPAQVPDKDLLVAYGDQLAPRVARMAAEERFKEPVDPARFDMEDLLERFSEYGAAGYQLQFMLNTKLSDEERFPIKLKNLIISPVPPEKAPREINWLPNPDRVLKDLPTHGMAGDRYYSPASLGHMFSEYTGRVMAIDPSGRGADETGYAVGYELSGNIWVPEAGGLEGGYDMKTLEALAAIAKRRKVHTIVLESNFGDGMFGKLLQPVLSTAGVLCEVVETRSTSMKEMRILDVLEPVVGSHRLIVDPEVVLEDDRSIQKYEGMIRNHKSLFHQMTHICREKGALKKDDRVDALSMLVAHFVDIMDQDAKKAADRQHQEWLMAELDKIHQNPMAQAAVGSGGGRMLWNRKI
ncbi:phage terminase large subunit [uncultured Cohaesibacter sp.]|uniref:phage terminase large subunit n=1 Tax=uncultured Cohaesibacter sp. TaxID=1002546 RepID=UPI0029C8E4B4|nr:phage terminase large subunit [uncultured Cohaesibacter sp.]